MNLLERAVGALEKIRRSDGWSNVWSRLGTDLDRATHTQFVPQRLPDTVRANLFHGDDLCRTICSTYAEEGLRRGWGKVPELAHLETECGYSALEKIQRAAIFGRAFGGAVVVIGADDRQDPAEPLNIECAGRIEWLKVYDKRLIEKKVGSSRSLYDAKVFRISPLYGAPFDIHRSRCLVFKGMLTADQEQEALGGWDISILDVVYEVVRGFNDGYLSAVNMLGDASTPVLKMKGLIAAMAGGQKEDIATRAQLISLTRSVARTVLIDADSNEDFSRVATAFAGMSDILDRLANRLAAATRIPVTILMGQAPAGLNATGDNDVRAFYDRVQSYRENEIDPQVDKLFRIAKIDRKPAWPSLWQETEQEKATRTGLEMTRDVAAVTAGIVLPEEVAQTDRIKVLYPTIDLSLRVTETTTVDPAAPPAEAPTSDEEFATQDEEPGRLAEAMTASKLELCEHGRRNRCPLCGIERLRGFEMGADGMPQWRIAWRAIPR